jgi:hypothetical protein
MDGAYSPLQFKQTTTQLKHYYTIYITLSQQKWGTPLLLLLLCALFPDIFATIVWHNLHNRIFPLKK